MGWAECAEPSELGRKESVAGPQSERSAGAAEQSRGAEETKGSEPRGPVRAAATKSDRGPERPRARATKSQGFEMQMKIKSMVAITQSNEQGIHASKSIKAPNESFN